MSTQSRVEVTRQEDGWFVAVDEDTGTQVRARTKLEALTAITSALMAIDRMNQDALDRYESLRSDVQQRVDDEDLDEDVVAEAIEWARSR